ncbi:hypothetical protein N9Z41_00440 [bacterium]|nr:hypothetical protein [bacterium]
MKKLLLILLFPILTYAQDCYKVERVVSTAEIEELNQRRIIFGIKQMTEEVLSEKYDLCVDGKPIFVEVLSIEAPSKGISLGPWQRKKKETVVKIKVIIDNEELFGEGLAKTSVESTFIDLNDENLPFQKTTFASAVKKAIEQILF